MIIRRFLARRRVGKLRAARNKRRKEDAAARQIQISLKYSTWHKKRKRAKELADMPPAVEAPVVYVPAFSEMAVQTDPVIIVPIKGATGLETGLAGTRRNSAGGTAYGGSSANTATVPSSPYSYASGSTRRPSSTASTPTSGRASLPPHAAASSSVASSSHSKSGSSEASSDRKDKPAPASSSSASAASATTRRGTHTRKRSEHGTSPIGAPEEKATPSLIGTSRKGRGSRDVAPASERKSSSVGVAAAGRKSSVGKPPSEERRLSSASAKEVEPRRPSSSSEVKEDEKVAAEEDAKPSEVTKEIEKGEAGNIQHGVIGQFFSEAMRRASLEVARRASATLAPSSPPREEAQEAQGSGETGEGKEEDDRVAAGSGHPPREGSNEAEERPSFVGTSTTEL